METKDGILLEMKAMEKTVEELRNNLNPTQIAKFLLLADKSKTTQEFDIFRLWEIKKNRSRPEMQEMLQQVAVQPLNPVGIPSSELHSSKNHDGSSSLEIQNPDEESSQGGFVPNEDDEQNDHYRAMREAVSKSSPEEATDSYDHM